MADEKMIITIGREHGTMGEKIAEKLRRRFDLPFYDKTHLLRAVEGTNDYDELNAFFNDRKVNSLLYAIAMSENVRSNEVPFGIIKKVVGDTGGIVMDSCGNYLFRNRPNTIRIFLHYNAPASFPAAPFSPSVRRRSDCGDTVRWPVSTPADAGAFPRWPVGQDAPDTACPSVPAFHRRRSPAAHNPAIDPRST